MSEISDLIDEALQKEAGLFQRGADAIRRLATKGRGTVQKAEQAAAHKFAYPPKDVYHGVPHVQEAHAGIPHVEATVEPPMPRPGQAAPRTTPGRDANGWPVDPQKMQMNVPPKPAAASGQAAQNVAAQAAPEAAAAAAASGRNPRSAMDRFGKPAALAGMAGAVGYGAYRSGQNAAEQDARTRDLMAARQQDMNAQMPSMTVLASYAKFAQEKVANGMPVYNNVQTAMAKSLGDTLADRLVAQPIDAMSGLLRKKLYDEPKQKAVFDHVVGEDPHLQQAHAANPKQLQEMYHTLKKFAPSLAVDRNATKSFLRQAMMAGGQLDYATIRMLAETEKFVQNSKGRGTNG